MERINFNKAEHKATFQRLALPSEAIKFATTEGEGGTVKGYFAVWGVLSSDRGGYLVTFAQGGMKLPSYDVVLYYNHDDSEILARESNNSLVIGEDEYGGFMTASLVDGQYEKDLVKRIKSGLITGMSCGVFPLKTHDEQRMVTAEDAQGNPDLAPFINQTIDVEVWDEFLLDEATITPRPAFQQTTLEAFKAQENISANEGRKEENDEEYYTYKWEALVRGLTID